MLLFYHMLLLHWLLQLYRMLLLHWLVLPMQHMRNARPCLATRGAPRVDDDVLRCWHCKVYGGGAWGTTASDGCTTSQPHPARATVGIGVPRAFTRPCRCHSVGWAWGRCDGLDRPKSQPHALVFYARPHFIAKWGNDYPSAEVCWHENGRCG